MDRAPLKHARPWLGRLLLALLAVACGSADDGPSPEGGCVFGDPAVFELGFRRAAGTDPGDFQTITADSTVAVVHGTQGAWMVILAIRTNQLPAGTLRADLVASLDNAAGERWGHIELIRHLAHPNADGLCYLRDTYLVVPSSQEWDGEPATLTVQVTTDSGATVGATLGVRLEKTEDEVEVR